MKLYFVRHGETAVDNPEKCYGATDVDLSDKGYEQAHKLAKRFRNEKITAIYSSTLKRGLATAGIIAEVNNNNVIPCTELNEVNFGQIEGITFAEACIRFPVVTDAWSTNSAELCFPLGESFKQFKDRVSSFTERLKMQQNDDAVLVVGHGGPFKVLLCQLLGLDFKHFGQFRFDMASVSQFSIFAQGAMLEKLSDLSHLDNDIKG